MNKKLLIFGILSVLLLLGACPIPLNVAICGNDVCESGEQSVCPGDCEGAEAPTGTTAAGEICDNICSVADEMCTGYWQNGGFTCCSKTCQSEITQITFKEGWNYISFPEPQLNGDVEDILPADMIALVDSIYTYYDDGNENAWKVWRNSNEELSTADFELQGGRGYIFYMTSAYTLQLSDIEEAIAGLDSIAPVPVYTGWNLIGVASGDEDYQEKPLNEYLDSIAGTYTSLWMYDSYQGDLSSVSLYPFEVNNDDRYYNMIPTKAYWIYVTADGEIEP